MIKIAGALNSFAHVAQQVDVQPSEEPIFILTSSKLQEVLTRDLQPLQNEVRDLKDISCQPIGKDSSH